MKKLAFIFPGQGSQFAGMGKDIYLKNPEVRSLFDIASSVTGLNLPALCFDSPLEKLTETINLQPAITVVNLACLAILKQNGIEAHVVAGHSLGEYSALFAAGILDLKDVFHLVAERGRLMQREAEKNPGSMAAIVGLDLKRVKELTDLFTGKGVVAIANYNAEKQIVITGEKEALEDLSRKITRGAKFIPLNVSGAWHSPLMAGAVDDFKTLMNGVNFCRPSIPMLFNVTADFCDEPDEVREIMSRQICSPVLWYDILQKMIATGISVLIEVGPKKVLSGLLKKSPPPGDFQVHQADDIDGLMSVAEKIKGHS